ncbi:UbiA family prenyltransferase [Georgenia faecalis]|uniref:UbiA family prenyltransferase n=1 Tax=Georgenia faecalis TaxID=2483799 RepID=A0ABV9DA35_9MICO|nr:UbiA family prenyltransferase [Georgenia faecalis]
MRTLVALARACHPAPTVAVTTLAAGLGVAAGLGPARTALLGLAVLAGQLTIGWTNDLLDAERDRRVGRASKPVATGDVAARTVVVATGAALAVSVVASLALGVRPGLVHLVLLVGSGWAYNLGLKATALSWLPYAVAFGALPAVAWLAVPAPVPGWMVAVGALLGVGAHILNVLPDLEDDATTGVRGLPHRLGARAGRVVAVVVLLAGSVVAVLGPAGPTPAWGWVVLAGVAALAAVAVAVGGKAPFRIAMLIAVVNVVVLLLRP